MPRFTPDPQHNLQGDGRLNTTRPTGRAGAAVHVPSSPSWASWQKETSSRVLAPYHHSTCIEKGKKIKKKTERARPFRDSRRTASRRSTRIGRRTRQRRAQGIDGQEMVEGYTFLWLHIYLHTCVCAVQGRHRMHICEA